MYVILQQKVSAVKLTVTVLHSGYIMLPDVVASNSITAVILCYLMCRE